MVDQIRFFAGAARVLEGTLGRGVHGRPHLVDPPRADRRLRPGDAVELPDDDGGLEDRPGARRRQHRRAQAVATPRRSSTTLLAELAAEEFPAGRAQRGLRRPRHRPRPGRAPDPADGRRSPARCAPAWRSPTSAAADLKRVHLELGGKAPVLVFDDADLEAAAEAIAVAGYFNAGQDCTAATRVLAGPGIHDDFVAALAEQAQGTTHRRCPTTRTPTTARSTTPPSSTGSAASSTGCPTTPRSLAGGVARAATRLLLRAHRRRRPAPGRRADPERDLRPGHHRAAVHRRGRGARAGPTASSTAWPPASGPRTTAGPCGCRAGSTSAASGSTPTSRWSPRCPTAASSTPATARTSPCTASRTTPASSTSCRTSVSESMRILLVGAGGVGAAFARDRRPARLLRALVVGDIDEAGPQRRPPRSATRRRRRWRSTPPTPARCEALPRGRASPT